MPTIEMQIVQRLMDGEVQFDIEKGRVVGQQMDVDKRIIGFAGPDEQHAVHHEDGRKAAQGRPEDGGQAEVGRRRHAKSRRPARSRKTTAPSPSQARQQRSDTTSSNSQKLVKDANRKQAAYDTVRIADDAAVRLFRLAFDFVHEHDVVDAAGHFVAVRAGGQV